jgi:hypothetical protein
VGLPDVEVLAFVLSVAARPVSDFVAVVVVGVVAPTFAPVLASTDPAAVPAAAPPVAPPLSLLLLGFEHATKAMAHAAIATRLAMLLFMSLLP